MTISSNKEHRSLLLKSSGFNREKFTLEMYTDSKINTTTNNFKIKGGGWLVSVPVTLRLRPYGILNNKPIILLSEPKVLDVAKRHSQRFRSNEMNHMLNLQQTDLRSAAKIPINP